MLLQRDRGSLHIDCEKGAHHSAAFRPARARSFITCCCTEFSVQATASTSFANFYNASGGVDASPCPLPPRSETSELSAHGPRPTPYKPSGDAGGPPTPGGGHGPKSRSKSHRGWGQLRGKKIESLSNLKPKPLAATNRNMRDNNMYAVAKNQLLGYSSLNLLDLVEQHQVDGEAGVDVIVSDLKCESSKSSEARFCHVRRGTTSCAPNSMTESPPPCPKNKYPFTLDSGTRSNSYLEPNRVSISVLVPGLLLVFVTSAFTVVGMLVFILRNRKRSKRREGNSSASEINSLQTVCDSSYWHSGPYHADGGAHRGFDCSTHLSTTNDA
ncbi:SLIT and NTRK-like protein 1 [Lates japonicus]|uniref:SLIT and NTRK-like protein 1 n=1 Tax=Lates japonicus TaxID=270547 RepID=A0AAD3MS25_LATJO|nr:SLIT and NTRK-like protein 1 [Lates japonicus]